MDAKKAKTGIWQSPFATDFGIVIVNNSSQSILSLDVGEIVQLFRSSSLILFRGFAPGEHRFIAFTEKFANRFLRHKNMARTMLSEDGTLLTVSPGTQRIRAHTEMAYSPIQPDVIWFHCVRPASEGGETFVVDGVRVLQEMTTQTRELLLSKKVKHRFHGVHPETWQRLLATNNLSDALRMLDSFPGFTYEMNAAGHYDSAFVTSAIKSTKYGQQRAFNSSILDVGGVFEDDSHIPRDVFSELTDLTMELSHAISWQPDDIAMIDNTRILHGRPPFADARRSLRIRMGNLEM